MNKLIVGLIAAVFIVFGVGLYLNNQNKERAAALEARIQAAKLMQQEEILKQQREDQLRQRAVLSNESREYIAAKEKKEKEQAEAQKNAEQNSASIEQMDALYKEWQDVERVAGQTSRIALSQPVQRLQDIQRKLDQVPTTECTKDAQAALSSGMSKVISGYLNFMSGKGVGEVLAKADLDDSEKFFEEYDREVGQCKR